MRGTQVAPEEQSALVRGFADNASIQGSGIKLNKQKYFTLQANDRSIYGKQGVRATASSPHTLSRLTGLAWACSQMAACASRRSRPSLSGFTKKARCPVRAPPLPSLGSIARSRSTDTPLDGHCAGEATKIVEALADYLISVEY